MCTRLSTKQAFLNAEMGDEVIYIRAPDWWPEQVPYGHVLQLMKSMYGTRQAARQWHGRISSWMEEHEYLAVNNEKTMFMKWQGTDWIMHGVFVDDMMHTSTSTKMLKEFFALYAKDFSFSGGELMTSFLGMEVEQEDGCIKLHLDTYVKEMIEEYKNHIKRDLKPKQTPMQPGVVLTKDDCPETPDPKEQKFYRSMSAKTQFVGHWIRFDVSYTAAQLARFCASAGVSHWAALHHLMGYLEHNPSFKLTYREGHSSGLDGYADSDWGNSESRRSTTGILARYNKSAVLWRSNCKRLSRYRPQKPNIMLLPKWRSRSSTFAICSTTWVSNQTMIPQSMKTTQHASNGETTLSADASVLSTSTSASTLLMRRFKIDTCDSSKLEPTTKWRTYSPRRYRFLLSCDVWKASCAVQWLRRDLEPPEGARTTIWTPPWLAGGGC